MRLLHAKDFTFKEFVGKNIPKYAIISHKWKDEEEVSYHDFIEKRDRFLRGLCKGYGWTKIAEAGKMTSRYGLFWFWIDTCCIDKKSSAELSEAINSMFKWYKNADICYVFLPDVYAVDNSNPSLEEGPFFSTPSGYSIRTREFQSSVWFSRAWTLQELLAPTYVAFLSSDFSSIWCRHDPGPMSLVSKRTTIPEEYLRWQVRREVREASVAERMRWASRREATREEDQAYSLLGLFGVNMPLLYGEGNRAFMRLQSEIIRTSNDESIFAWKFERPILKTGLLAHSIHCFSSAENIVRTNRIARLHYEQTNMGLRLTVPVSEKFLKFHLFERGHATVLMPLNCTADGEECPALELVVSRMSGVQATRELNSTLGLLYGRKTHGDLIPCVDQEHTRNERSMSGSRLSRLTTPCENAYPRKTYTTTGIGERQVDVSIYFPEVIELDARGPESLDPAALSEEWGLRTIFAERDKVWM